MLFVHDDLDNVYSRTLEFQRGTPQQQLEALTELRRRCAQNQGGTVMHTRVALLTAGTAIAAVLVAVVSLLSLQTQSVRDDLLQLVENASAAGLTDIVDETLAAYTDTEMPWLATLMPLVLLLFMTLYAGLITHWAQKRDERLVVASTWLTTFEQAPSLVKSGPPRWQRVGRWLHRG